MIEVVRFLQLPDVGIRQGAKSIATSCKRYGLPHLHEVDKNSCPKPKLTMCSHKGQRNLHAKSTHSECKDRVLSMPVIRISCSIRHRHTHKPACHHHSLLSHIGRPGVPCLKQDPKLKMQQRYGPIHVFLGNGGVVLMAFVPAKLLPQW